ncbi:MAG: hypothetical protein ABFR62_01085, partial [Bacteroidota bacterium]
TATKRMPPLSLTLSWINTKGKILFSFVFSEQCNRDAKQSLTLSWINTKGKILFSFVFSEQCNRDAKQSLTQIDDNMIDFSNKTKI